MSEITIAVIGAGRFGEALAIELAQAGVNVLVFDRKKDVVKRLEALGAMNCVWVAPGQLEALIKHHGPQEWDVAVVAIGEDFEQQQKCVLVLEDIGVKTIIGRAQSETHQEILRLIAPDTIEIIRPERECAKALALKLVRHELKSVLSLKDDCQLIEAAIPTALVGYSLKELRIGAEHGVLVVGVTRGGASSSDPESEDRDNGDDPRDGADAKEKENGSREPLFPPGAETILEKDDTFTLVGRTAALKDFLALHPKR